MPVFRPMDLPREPSGFPLVDLLGVDKTRALVQHMDILRIKLGYRHGVAGPIRFPGHV